MPNRLLLMRLCLIFYILLCLVFSGLAAWNFRARLSHLSSVSGFVSLLALYLIILSTVAFFLAVGFAILTGGRLFALINFVAAELFFVLPATLLIFSAIVWASRPPQLSPVAVSAVSLTLLISAVLLVGTYIYAHFIEPYRLQTTFYQIRSSKLAGLEDRLRIVVLADIQTDSVSDYEQGVFRRTLELKPDLILFAGDYLQCPDRKSYLLQAQRLAKMLNDLSFNAPLGVFAVLGNCDPRGGSECFDNTAVQWLTDRSTSLDLPKVAIRLTGLSLKTGRMLKAGPADLLSSLDSSTFNIVLSHHPDFVLDLPAGHDIDLCLAGHTHGGQICLPFIGPLTTFSRIPRSQVSGSHQVNGTRLFISRGIGMERKWAPRLRFLCPPQIMVIDLMGD